MTAALPHLPVMLDETLEALSLKADHWYIDATFGAGGHSRALLAAGMQVFAIDQDPHVARHVEGLREEFDQDTMTHFKLKQGNFRHMDQYALAASISPVGGILMDIGVSSMQLDDGERGFAFRQDGPLDMRMSGKGESAADIVNGYEQEALAAIIYRYGEERFSRRIAREIVNSRPLNSTGDLVRVIQKAYPGGARRDHPARRTFQALRIHVNDELGALEDALHASEKLLADEGRIVVLSYHSLEDRIVKQFIKKAEGLEPVHKKPLTASPEEARRNPRARSAKLRVAVKQSEATSTATEHWGKA